MKCLRIERVHELLDTDPGVPPEDKTLADILEIYRNALGALAGHVEPAPLGFTVHVMEALSASSRDRPKTARRPQGRPIPAGEAKVLRCLR